MWRNMIPHRKLRDFLASIVDNGIATAATHRQIWYLQKEAQLRLEDSLSLALELRGDAAIRSFTRTPQTEAMLEGLSEERLSEIRRAIAEAQQELANDATPASEEAEPAEEIQETD